MSCARSVLHNKAGSRKWSAVLRAQISQFGAALTASRQTQTAAHSGGDARVVDVEAGSLNVTGS